MPGLGTRTGRLRGIGGGSCEGESGWRLKGQEAGFISNACWVSLMALGTFLKEGSALGRSVWWQEQGKVIFDSSKITAVPSPL